jgi:hypothetical protein
MSGGFAYSVTLEWSAVADPDGDPVEYQVQVNYTSDFTSPTYESGWIDTSDWTLTVPPGGIWFWHVQARDALHTDAVSPWSSVDDFYDMTMPGSCPFLFVWDGQGYEYLTDIQGPAIGLPRKVLTTQNIRRYRSEAVVLEGLEKDARGSYRLSIRETQTEITYVDQVKLLVVDHPAGTSLVSSTAESTYSYGYSEPFEIITVGDGARPPQKARDRGGEDVLDTLLEVDGESVGANAPDWFELDFGKVERPEHVRLVIDGWSVYDRRKYPQKKLVQPYVEVRDEKGKWVEVRSFGNIAGDTKRMAIDLSGALVTDDHRIRIHTGQVHAIRWLMDRIVLDDSPPAEVDVRTVLASKAVLGHGGRVPHFRANLEHPNLVTGGNLPDNEPSLSFGSFTRYGDVLELMQDADDMYAILRHGDMLELVFPSLEPPAPGMERTLILESVLWYKHLSTSDMVTPLPYIGMQTYPAEGYPDDAAHRAYLEKYSTRTYEKP